MTGQTKGWFGAGAVTLGVALMIGCGGSGFNPNNPEQAGLKQNVRILPNDGRSVVTAIGEKGLRVAGPALDNVQPGDILVVCSPILDSARTAIGHKGGYMRLTNGMHLVPAEKVPARLRARGPAAGYYLIALEKVRKKKVWDKNGNRLPNGSVAYGSTTGGRETRFISSIAHDVGHAVTDGAHAVANAATDVAQTAAAATENNATNIDEASITDTSNSTSIANAESAVASAVTSATGPITSEVITEIETVGADFAALFSNVSLTLSVPQLPDINVPIPSTGFTGSVDANVNGNSVGLTLNSVQVGASPGPVVTASGSMSLSANANITLDIQGGIPTSVSGNLIANAQASLTVAGGGQGSLEWGEMQFEPIIIPAGDVPIVIVPVLALRSSVQGTINVPTLTGQIGGNVSWSAGIDSYNQTGASFTDSGFVGPFTGATGKLNPVGLRLTFNIYDLAGPYFEIDPVSMNITSNGSTSQLGLGLNLTGGVNLDPLGFDGWSVGGSLYQDTYYTTSF